MTVRAGSVSFEMVYHSNSDFWYAKMIPFHEPECLEFFVEWLSNRTAPVVVYDIGAYVGFYSLFAAAHSGDLTAVAFEPCRASYEKLVENIGANGFDNIVALNLAVGDPGSASSPGVMLSGKGGSTAIAIDGEQCTSRDRYEAVALVSINGLVRERRIPPPDFVKIDIEGYELEALRGMEEVLVAHSPVILVEVHAEALERRGASVEELIQFVERIGYRGVSLRGKGEGRSFGHRQEHLVFSQVV